MKEETAKRFTISTNGDPKVADAILKAKEIIAQQTGRSVDKIKTSEAMIAALLYYVKDCQKAQE